MEVGGRAVHGGCTDHLGGFGAFHGRPAGAAQLNVAIAWAAPVRRALARLPEKAATAAVEFLYGSLAANPHRAGKPLRLGLGGLHSARRGDYRVIYRIDDGIWQVTVLAIEHRSDIYQPRQS
jgi:mRNA-degrading endonuclease RelE of RelBE toxin-antitoxin system